VLNNAGILPKEIESIKEIEELKNRIEDLQR